MAWCLLIPKLCFSFLWRTIGGLEGGGVESDKELGNHSMRGALFENLIVLEALKHPI